MSTVVLLHHYLITLTIHVFEIAIEWLHVC